MRIRPPRVPRYLRTVRLSWFDYAKLRFTAMNNGLSLSTAAGAAITLYADACHADNLTEQTPDRVYLNLKLLPEEATALDNLALRLEVEADSNVTLGRAFACLIAQMPMPRLPIATQEDLGQWLKVTYSKFKTSRVERVFREGWQKVAPSSLSEQRRILRTARRARNLART